VRISFDNATLIHSNLGGQGGPTTLPAAAAQYIHYANVGAMPDGTPIDLRVTNVSAYHSYNPAVNDVRPPGPSPAPLPSAQRESARMEAPAC
jgi:hypothetical protein